MIFAIVHPVADNTIPAPCLARLLLILENSPVNFNFFLLYVTVAA
jgi:hypothetical protein